MKKFCRSLTSYQHIRTWQKKRYEKAERKADMKMNVKTQVLDFEMEVSHDSINLANFQGKPKDIVE